MQTIDFSVDCKWIAPMDDAVTLLEGHTIGVSGAVIVALLPTEKFYTIYNAQKRFDMRHLNRLFLPGLVNCHTHVPLSLMRGYQDDVDLHDWLEKYIWPTEGKFVSKDFVRLGTELAVYEMLKTGTTMFNDMYYFPEDIIAVCKKAGIRVVTGWPIIDLGKGDMVEQVKHSICFAKQLKEEDHPLVRPSLVAHSVYATPVEYQKDLLADPELGDVVFHTHLNETTKEIDDYLEKHGKTPVEALHAAGALRKNGVYAHSVHLDKPSLATLSTSGASCCHCPKSNMRLGCGLCDVQTIRKSNINVCLGTDSAASNNSLSLLCEGQFAYLLEKVISGHPSSSTIYDTMKMCTINGAKALGRGKELGSLEVGKLCDLISVDLGELEMSPIFDPLSAAINALNPRVTHVWIHGNLVVNDGEVCSFRPDVCAIKEMCDNIANFRLEMKSKATA